MPNAVTKIQDIIHAIAGRAIRHDLRTPLNHVEAYCGQIRDTLHRRPELMRDRLSRPSEVAANTIDIPALAREIDDALTDLETTLESSAYQTGAETQVVLEKLIDGECADLELKAAALKVLLEPDQQCSEYAIRVLKNAKAARSRLRSLKSFFKAEYAQRIRSKIDLREQADRAARDVSPNSSTYVGVFSFSGHAQIYGSEVLIQTLFQNIYENTLRYGANTRNLRSHTSFTQGRFGDLSRDIEGISEHPVQSGQWIRTDLKNNGPRLSAVDPNSVFQLGKRFDVEGINDDEGQGLGMSICFAVATLHRGFIWAHSGEAGAHFSVFLPCLVEDGFNDAQLLGIAKRMRIT
ncbi:ATP-binding protein [Novosphingobium album (ex Liu et al. 2023)]|uniref:histidine kinase n=1 Tax=Novosphingobium album (ex Liu et al. 2023) TaxID=3031130 RepID=A0ABT5WXN6_9SPHN|nr:ATP-binding protein [Novosphingobium album (ex Liu et al. 2023)]MDE8654621.1 ATP-binding protein [Novosphingobium album (ex Liu et al. 2023)]